jgi:hypothetical protein
MEFFSKWEENFTAKPQSTQRKSLFLGFEKPERIFSFLRDLSASSGRF